MKPPAPNSGHALDLEGISKSFGIVRALDDVSISVIGGTIHGVVGQNGAGKSTLMRILAGAFPPDRGVIRLRGDQVRPRNPDHARRLGIRIIYQELTLVPALTVAENIFLGIEPRTRTHTVDRRAMRDGAERLLAELGHGQEFAVDKPVEFLDIGRQQLVEIAKALAWDAEILILDEPTAALEHQDVERLFGVLNRFREQGRTALYVSHRLDEIFEVCDRVSVLRDGKLVDTLPIEETSKGKIIQMMIGRSLGVIFPPRAADGTGPAVLEVEKLTGSILEDVSFEVPAHRILGVVGLEGSGIRELAKVLAGDRPITEGEVRVNGKRADVTSPRSAREAGIVYLSADRKQEGLFQILSVSQNIAIGTLAERTRAGVIDRGEERQLVGRSIERFSILTPSARQEVQYLSGGNQQKLLLARALAAKPTVFVLEEPTRGVDVGGKAEIYRLMRELADAGAAVVMISNDLPEVLGLSDQVVALFEGRVSATFPGGVQEDQVLEHIL